MGDKMGEALYDKEGNQIYSGKGRKSAAVKELLDKGDVYVMKDDKLIKIGGKSADEIQSEIDKGWKVSNHNNETIVGLQILQDYT